MLLPIIFVVLALSSMVQAQSRGELRLVRGSAASYSYTSGRLEIFMNGRWGTICNDADFGQREATVACQQLGWNGALGYGNSTSMGFGQGDGAILLDNVNCYYTSFLHLLFCQYSTAISRSCSHADDVAVTCYSTRLSDIPYELRVRLVGGRYPSQGRVEVYCNGQWGTICSTSRFGATEAETVCRQLGYTDASSYNNLSLEKVEVAALFYRPGNDTQPIWLQYFSCGSYSHGCLDVCTSCPLQHSIPSCNHSSDVTVQCDYQYGSPSNKITCPSNTNTGGGGGSNIGWGGGSYTGRPTDGIRYTGDVLGTVLPPILGILLCIVVYGCVVGA